MYFLNQLQYFLMRPWRYWYTRPSERAHYWWNLLFIPLLLPITTVLYFLSAPLRFVNALVYNLLLYNIATIYDRLAEIIVPKRGVIRFRYGADYWLTWIIGFPWRFFKHGTVILLAILESLAMTIWDTIFPALTLYHGTSGDAGVSISQKGKWKVGEGNFAGSGLYFAIDKSTAEHYARWGLDPIIIKARVTLGFSFPLACAPANIRQALYGRNGDKITRWGRKNGIKSVEWWRHDTGWWEYALLYPRGKYIDTWRIRIIYIESKTKGRIKRIWGGKSLWMNSMFKY